MSFVDNHWLEALFEQNAQGIIASNLEGTLTMMNHFAETIFGYNAVDVVGSMPIAQLYPDGTYKDAIKRLHSDQHGEPGVLLSFRLDGQTAEGNRIPLVLTAGVLRVDGSEIGTFNMVTDWRERVLLEDRLTQSQERFLPSEKNTIIAELAGTVSHELNQPLTSVLGYAELLRRKLPTDTVEAKCVLTILREAERMADIVKKLGNITNYETVDYVGQQKILDLDKAAGSIKR